MTPPPLHTAGLSGDLGWNEDDESHLDGPRTAMLLAATCLYWGSLWVSAGFPPLVCLADRVRLRRRAGTHGKTVVRAA